VKRVLLTGRSCWVTVRGQRVDLLVLTLVNQQGLWLVD
jgi:hypothetical protein